MAALPDGRTREEHNNARFTILAQNPDGSNRVTLVPWRGGGVNIIYDMRQAGYILARIDTGLYADNYEYTLFFDNGRIAKLDYFERDPRCGFHLGIPSPSGDVIAIQTMVAPAGTTESCPSDLDATIRFIEADTQNEIDRITYIGRQETHSTGIQTVSSSSQTTAGEHGAAREMSSQPLRPTATTLEPAAAMSQRMASWSRPGRTLRGSPCR